MAPGDGHRNGGYERGTPERTLPMTSVFLASERANIFDGTEANFPAWKWRIEHRLAKLNLGHTLVRTPAEETFFAPATGATAEQG